MRMELVGSEGSAECDVRGAEDGLWDEVSERYGITRCKRELWQDVLQDIEGQMRRAIFDKLL